MIKIEHYKHFGDIVKCCQSIELALLAILGLSSLTVFNVFNLIRYSDNDTVKFGWSVLCLIIVGLSWVALFCYLSVNSGDYKIFLSLYFDYLSYKSTKADLSTKYKYAIIDSRGGSEYFCNTFTAYNDGTLLLSSCDCENDIIWKEKDMLVLSYEKIIDLSDGHTLALTEIKNHALPILAPKHRKGRRASKSKGRK